MADGKMSKSKGNVIYADDLVHEFGVDAVRYYFLHEIPYASDGIFSRELLIDRINGDLVNILGNLVNRTVSMAHKYFDGTITNAKVKEDVDTDFIQAISSLDEKVTVKMDDLHIGEALDEIFDVLRKSNKYIDDTTPWILAKDETKKGRLETVLYNLLESIRICAIFLSPFLPDTSEKIFNQLNTQNRTYETKDFGMLESPITLNTPQHLFSRIDETVK